MESRRIGLLGVVAALGVGLAVAGRRLAAGRRGRDDVTYTCECGTVYRVTGIDRHRVYWRDGDAVLGDRCVACEAPLPASHDGIVV
jgi:hypothetical protein